MAGNQSEPVSPLGWIGAGVLGLGVLIWAASGNQPASDAASGNADVETNLAAENLATDPAQAAPPPLDVSAAQRGYGQFRMVSALKDSASAVIYSRNCYDALAKAFDWHQLDRCGGFDALAARAIDQDESADSDELSYFQSEAAAGRFLQAAGAAELDSSEADQRWSRLQQMALRVRLPKAAAQPAIVGSDIDATEDASDVNALQESFGGPGQ